jgi:hypothetical protein
MKREIYKDLIRVIPETGEEIVHQCQMGTDTLSWILVKELDLWEDYGFKQFRIDIGHPGRFHPDGGCSVCFDIRRKPEILEKLDISNVKLYKEYT